jgi:hypothetical protein
MDQAHALSNLITLTTPGGIERQERQGQAQFVASQQLPRKFNGHPDGRQVLEGFGFRYGINADELFVNVQFPEGWVKQGGNHAMWSTVVDEQGRTRLSIFYKAAFYDTDAFINISRRFRISLQPCDISESEFYKIHDYLIENIPFKNSDISNPIDITDIVKEKDGKIYFKQPTEKQVESECEAVELNIKLTEYCHKCGDGCCTNYGTITEINGEELPCHNQDAETILKQVLEHLGYKVNIETVTDYS